MYIFLFLLFCLDAFSGDPVQFIAEELSSNRLVSDIVKALAKTTPHTTLAAAKEAASERQRARAEKYGNVLYPASILDFEMLSRVMRQWLLLTDYVNSRTEYDLSYTVPGRTEHLIMVLFSNMCHLIHTIPVQDSMLKLATGLQKALCSSTEQSANLESLKKCCVDNMDLGLEDLIIAELFGNEDVPDEDIVHEKYQAVEDWGKFNAAMLEILNSTPNLPLFRNLDASFETFIKNFRFCIQNKGSALCVLTAIKALATIRKEVSPVLRSDSVEQLIKDLNVEAWMPFLGDQHIQKVMAMRQISLMEGLIQHEVPEKVAVLKRMSNQQIFSKIIREKRLNIFLNDLASLFQRQGEIDLLSVSLVELLPKLPDEPDLPALQANPKPVKQRREKTQMMSEDDMKRVLRDRGLPSSRREVESMAAEFLEMESKVQDQLALIKRCMSYLKDNPHMSSVIKDLERKGLSSDLESQVQSLSACMLSEPNHPLSMLLLK